MSVPRPTSLSTSIDAAVQPHQLLHQRETDAAAFVRAAARAFDAVKALEQTRQLVRGNAGAGVAHASRPSAPPADFDAQGDCDAAFEA